MYLLLLSCPFYLLTVGAFTAPVISDYELSEQAMHPEIEWFFATTFKCIGTSPYRGTGEPVERDIIQFLVFRASVRWSPWRLRSDPSVYSVVSVSCFFAFVSRRKKAGCFLRPPLLFPARFRRFALPGTDGMTTFRPFTDSRDGIRAEPVLLLQLGLCITGSELGRKQCRGRLNLSRIL